MDAIHLFLQPRFLLDQRLKIARKIAVDEFGEAENGRQRRAQVVGYGGEKGRLELVQRHELLVRSLQLLGLLGQTLGPVTHCGLQVADQGLEPTLGPFPRRDVPDGSFDKIALPALSGDRMQVEADPDDLAIAANEPGLEVEDLAVLGQSFRQRPALRGVVEQTGLRP